MKSLVVSVLGFVVLACNVGIVPAATFDLLQTFDNPNPSSYDGFGFSVAASGNNVLIGSPANITGNSSSLGSAYLFSASTGGLLRTFDNPATGVSNSFGYSVAVSGDTLLISAPAVGNHGDEQGIAVYQFDPAGNILQTYRDPTPDLLDGFGYSVAVAGGIAVVGTPGDDTKAAEAGAAYLFSNSSEDTLYSPSPSASEIFGRSVAAMGDDILIGAPGRYGGNDSAYLLAADGSELQTFDSPGTPATEYFGYSVAAVGENVLVGAPGHMKDPTSSPPGKAYLFSGETGELLRTFESPTPTAVDRFGISVAALDNNVLIGASNDDTGATDAGAAYLFDSSTGELLGTILSPDPHAGDRFGNSVAFAGNDILIGAHGEDTASGTAYLFEVVPEPSSLVLLVTGVLGFIARGWRRRK